MKQNLQRTKAMLKNNEKVQNQEKGITCQNQEKGITLIALIVTIVIILILAGVTIKLAIDDNGVIDNAKEAKDQYEQAQADADNGLNDLSSEMKKYLEGNRKTSADKPNDDGEKEPKTETVDGVTIPEGFVYVGGTKNSGLVISDNSVDKEKYKGQEAVGTNLEGNQFVWIPVEKIADYKRTAYSPDTDTEIADTNTNSTKINSYNSDTDYFIEALSSDEKASVEKNKGYYIGRYEAGDKESTDAKTLRSSGASTSNTITIKSNQAPYNYVTRTQAISLAEGFGTKQNYRNVKTKLASSYAWDTAIAFIQKTVSDYGSNSSQGNYNDTTFNYMDITGISRTKASKSDTLIPTGQTTELCNIYDMGGNVWELTTEYYSGKNDPYSIRGGCYNNYITERPAGNRLYYPDYANINVGFRVALFL